jgi:hypothetical protein
MGFGWEPTALNPDAITQMGTPLPYFEPAEVIS